MSTRTDQQDRSPACCPKDKHFGLEMGSGLPSAAAIKDTSIAATSRITSRL